MSPRLHFVIVYSGTGEPPESIHAFDDGEVAMDAFEATQEKHRGSRLKVTLLGARSLDDLKVTHANLFGFGGVDAMVP